MFKWFRKQQAPQDKVLLRHHDNHHTLCDVEWFCGRPFAAPHLPDTRCELLPEGKLIGSCYIKGWLPATPSMEKFYTGAPQAPSKTGMTASKIHPRQRIVEGEGYRCWIIYASACPDGNHPAGLLISALAPSEAPDGMTFTAKDGKRYWDTLNASKWYPVENTEGEKE